jgi:hypothetical protein
MMVVFTTAFRLFSLDVLPVVVLAGAVFVEKRHITRLE